MGAESDSSYSRQSAYVPCCIQIIVSAGHQYNIITRKHDTHSWAGWSYISTTARRHYLPLIQTKLGSKFIDKVSSTTTCFLVFKLLLFTLIPVYCLCLYRERGWLLLYIDNKLLLGNMAGLIRNMTKMLYLRFHDKISAIIQYLFGIIIHLANIFNIQDSTKKWWFDSIWITNCM